MKDESTNPFAAHRETLLLLPWYVNKTLKGTELKAVENHIRMCQACKREIAMLQKLSVAVTQSDVIDTTAQASFSRLKKRIHQSGRAKIKALPKSTAMPGNSIRFWRFSFSFLPLPQPVLLALIVLMTLIPGYFIADRLLENNYQTLASSESPALNTNVIRVVFEESTNDQQRNKLIQSINGEVIDGPNEQGVYAIRLKQASDAKYILETISYLRNQPDVIFAEPAYALLSSSATKESPK